MSDCRDWFRFNHKWGTWAKIHRVNIFEQQSAPLHGERERMPHRVEDVYERTCSACGKAQRYQIPLAKQPQL